MKIIFGIDNYCAHYYINSGIARAFVSAGHDVVLWDMAKKSAMDAFDEMNPDIYFGHTYTITPSLIRAIEERPAMYVMLKASDFGTISDTIDRTKYPVLIANQREIDMMKEFQKRTNKPDFLFIHYSQARLAETHNHWQDIGFRVESILNGADVFMYSNHTVKDELKSDILYVGGFWPYKAEVLNKWLFPILSPKHNYNIKIFGNQSWSCPQYCGQLADEEVKNAFTSAKISVALSEPHSQDFGYDIPEKVFKTLCSKSFTISDTIGDLVKLIPNGIVYTKTPEDFLNKIDYYINKPNKRKEILFTGYSNVISNHTYHHRAAHIFRQLGLEGESKKIMQAYDNVKKELKL